MIPKTITHLSFLKEHDRFCFTKDKSRKVWQVVQHTIAIIHGESKKLTRCINDKFEKKRFDSNRVIIFLRSNAVEKKRKTELLLEDF